MQLRVASATHTYDGDGQRMGSSVFAPSPWSEAATNTAYTYGFDGLALRYLEAASEGASATITYLTHADGRAYAASYVATRGAETTGVVFELMVNDHGDVVALADATGEVFARYGYGPFGEDEGVSVRATDALPLALATEVASANPLRYAGYCYDTWSGHYYLQARY